MRVPLTWLRDYVAITDTPDELAARLTFAGLEVEDIEYVGLAPATQPIDGLPAAGRTGPRAKGLAWDPTTIVIAQILEVMPHPNADRLTLLRVDDGSGAEQIVLTGAPNIFHLKGTGPLADAHQGGLRARGRHPLRRPQAGPRGDDAQEDEDPRRRVEVDGLLREGAGHLRRARRHHPAG